MIQAFGSLHKFYRGFDGAANVLEQTIGKSMCVMGCGKCCEANTVKCMTIEAMNAISILAGHPDRLKAVVSLAEGWLLEKHEAAPTYEGMPKAGAYLSPKIRDEFHALTALPCPFLNDAKACVIHEARPIVCRAYGVTRTGSGFCPRSPGKGETLTQLMYIQAPGLEQDIESFKAKYRKEHPDWVVFGFLPTLIFRAAEEKKFRRYVANNQIASAKLVGTPVDININWNSQLEKLRIGIAPDLIAR